MRASTGGRVWVGGCGRELQHTPAYVHIKHFTGIQPSSVYNRPHCNRIRHTNKHGKGTRRAVYLTQLPHSRKKEISHNSQRLLHQYRELIAPFTDQENSKSTMFHMGVPTSALIDYI